MNLEKFNRILEIFWWSVAIITLILVIVMCVIEGWDKWGLFFIAPALAALMAIVRRFLGRKLANSQAKKNEK